MKRPECVAPTGCLLGQGPVWSPTENFLWWVDTKRAKLHRYNSRTGNARRYDLPIRASALALWKGQLLMAGDREVGVYDPATEVYETTQSLVELPAGCRTADGGVTPSGAFLVTTMDDDEQNVCGEYYMVSEGALPRKLDLPEVLVTNTIQFSPSGTVFYTCDSSERMIYAHDHDPESGEMSNRRMFAEASHANGFPNGSAIDESGALWTCEWGAGRVVRRGVDGQVLEVLELDAPRPTSCVFGGPDMRTLYITTARLGLTDKMFEANPLSGGLFAMDVDIPGPEPREFGRAS